MVITGSVTTMLIIGSANYLQGALRDLYADTLSRSATFKFTI
jgi:hypothetical protein